MKRILVPTDFSPTSEKAFRFALDIASKSESTVILYHAYTPVESTFIGTEKTRKQCNAEKELKLVMRLQRFKKKAAIKGVNVSTTLGRAPVIDNILDFAEKSEIDLIVMGTQGASGLKKIIIGSTAARVIQKSSMPVLLIPEKYQWKEPKQIVFATNYLFDDRKALAGLLAFAELYRAEVVIVHVYDCHVMEEEKERKDFEAYVFTLQREFKEFDLKFRFLKTSSVTETMANLDREIPYDMVVMVRRQKTCIERFLLKSLTRNTAYATRYPLLVVPAKAII